MDQDHEREILLAAAEPEEWEMWVDREIINTNNISNWNVPIMKRNLLCNAYGNACSVCMINNNNIIPFCIFSNTIRSMRYFAIYDRLKRVGIV